MKKFKIIDCIVQIVLLAVAMFRLFTDEGAAWWGKLNNEILFSILMGQLPSFGINIWQLISASVHTWHRQFNLQKARIVFFILYFLTLVVFFAFLFTLNSDWEKIRAISFLVIASVLIAVYYFIICVRETFAIKNKQALMA